MSDNKNMNFLNAWLPVADSDEVNHYGSECCEYVSRDQIVNVVYERVTITSLDVPQGLDCICK